MKTVRIFSAAIAIVLASAQVTADAGPRSGTQRPATGPRTVDVQLLAVNDFHGHLEAGTPGEIDGRPAGGAAFLASHVRRLAAGNPNTTVVSAGDLIGASPLLSALFHDEPAIEAMNMIGLDLNAVGNHELDEGAGELRRMQAGGCHAAEGCFGGDGFAGADFRFLAANTIDATTGEPIFPAYAIRRYGGVKVGFIGMTLEGTAEVTNRGAIRELRFVDEAVAAGRYARELRERHDVRAIVVLLHEGGAQERPSGIDTCRGISGPVVDIVERTTPAVDLFVTGHTHTPYACVIDGRPVTSAASYGRLVTDIDLRLDRRTRDVSRVRVDNVVVSQDVAPAPDVAELVERYRRLAAPVAAPVVGRLAATATRTRDEDGESAAGNLLADAQLAATRADAAFVNPGGVRADLEAGEITFGEAFTAQPFGNDLVTITLTGAQLLDVLEQQWCGQSARSLLLPSAGVAYGYDGAAADAIVAGRTSCEEADNPVRGLRIAGRAVEPAERYRITVSEFLADGGDRFPGFAAGTDRVTGVRDVDALKAYLAPSLAGEPIAPPALDRVSVVG